MNKICQGCYITKQLGSLAQLMNFRSLRVTVISELVQPPYKVVIVSFSLAHLFVSMAMECACTDKLLCGFGQLEDVDPTSGVGAPTAFLMDLCGLIMWCGRTATR